MSRERMLSFYKLMSVMGHRVFVVGCIEALITVLSLFYSVFALLEFWPSRECSFLDVAVLLLVYDCTALHVH